MASDLKSMMSDPRYWRDEDPKFVAMVRIMERDVVSAPIDWRARAEAAESRIADLERQNAALVAALKPFADLGITHGTFGVGVGGCTTIGMVRAAQAALAGTSDPTAEARRQALVDARDHSCAFCADDTPFVDGRHLFHKLRNGLKPLGNFHKCVLTTVSYPWQPCVAYNRDILWPRYMEKSVRR